MTFDAAELSAYAAAPIECYRFAVGGSVYRWTSSDQDVVISVGGDGSQTYATHAIRRGASDFSGEDESGALTISVPRTNLIAQMFLAYAPLSSIGLTIYRMHEGDAEIIVAFSGKVVAAAFDGSTAALTCSPMTSVLKRNIPRVSFQRRCAWVLYGGVCTVDPTHKNTGGTVTAIDGVKVSSTEFLEQADGHYTGGWMQRADGTRRAVVAHTGNTVSLQTPFFDLAVGEGVVVYFGCDKLEETCAAKFNNIAEFSGFKRAPTKNPHTVGVE